MNVLNKHMVLCIYIKNLMRWSVALYAYSAITTLNTQKKYYSRIRIMQSKKYNEALEFVQKKF